MFIKENQLNEFSIIKKLCKVKAPIPKYSETATISCGSVGKLLLKFEVIFEENIRWN